MATELSGFPIYFQILEGGGALLYGVSVGTKFFPSKLKNSLTNKNIFYLYLCKLVKVDMEMKSTYKRCKIFSSKYLIKQKK